MHLGLTFAAVQSQNSTVNVFAITVQTYKINIH